MRVPLLNILVVKDVYTTVQKTVPPHEMAVIATMQETTEKGNIKDVHPSGKFIDVEPEAEYARLARVYGGDTDRKQSYVEMAYGRLHEGRLEDTMAKSVEHFAEEAPKKKRKRPSRSKAAIAARAQEAENAQNLSAA